MKTVKLLKQVTQRNAIIIDYCYYTITSKFPATQWHLTYC